MHVILMMSGIALAITWILCEHCGLQSRLRKICFAAVKLSQLCNSLSDLAGYTKKTHTKNQFLLLVSFLHYASAVTPRIDPPGKPIHGLQNVSFDDVVGWHITYSLHSTQ